MGKKERSSKEQYKKDNNAADFKKKDNKKRSGTKKNKTNKPVRKSEYSKYVNGTQNRPNTYNRTPDAGVDKQKEDLKMQTDTASEEKVLSIEEQLDELMRCIHEKPDNQDYIEKYCSMIENNLKTKEQEQVVLSAIVKGIELGTGEIYLSYLQELNIAGLRAALKSMKNNEAVKENLNGNGLKLISHIFCQSILNTEKLANMRKDYLLFQLEMIENSKNILEEEAYNSVLVNYFVKKFPESFTFPEWNSLKLPLDESRQFIDSILKAVEKAEKIKSVFSVERWMKQSQKRVLDDLYTEKIEGKLPESKLDDIRMLLEHYTDVELQLKNFAYEIDRLEQEKDRLNGEITNLNGVNNELKFKIYSMENEMKKLQEQLEAAKAETAEHQKINDAFAALKKNDEEAIFKDIADELKAEYEDFMESVDDDVDIVLGEIYREKIRSIFKILKRKGIEVK